MFGLKILDFRQFLRSKKISNLIISFDIRHRIGTAGTTYGVLINKFNRLYIRITAFNFGELSRLFSHTQYFTLNRRIKYFTYQSTFSTPGNSRNCYKTRYWKTNIYVFEIVLSGTHNFNIIF